LPPSFVTHSSNHVSEIIAVSVRIAENSYEERLGLSVHFNTSEFYKNRSYAKTKPDQMDDVGTSDEGRATYGKRVNLVSLFRNQNGN
jgi:cysteinyl-tRNA synthetase